MRWWESSYKREKGGRWRYLSDSTYVPGAKDLRSGDLWRPKTIGHDWVEFPAFITRTPEFEWARQWWNTDEEMPKPTHAGGAIISAAEWDQNRTQLLGLTAPELCAQHMLTTETLATMLNIAPKTLSAYVARSYLPQPTVHHQRHPLWSVPVVIRTLTVARNARLERERKALHKRPPKTVVVDNLDQLLAQLGLDEPDDYELEHLDDE
jgi:hypothetical protein